MENELVKCDRCGGTGFEKFHRVGSYGIDSIWTCWCRLTDECQYPGHKSSCKIVKNSSFICVKCRGEQKLNWIQMIFGVR
jgi:hypothetical protein